MRAARRLGVLRGSRLPASGKCPNRQVSQSPEAEGARYIAAGQNGQQHQWPHDPRTHLELPARYARLRQGVGAQARRRRADMRAQVSDAEPESA